MNDLLIGIIQGITEFLPISSSGHLVIFSSISETIDLNTNDIAFLHIGTLFSILFFYRKRISETLVHKEELQHTLKIIIIAIIPAVLVGLLSPIQETIDNSENLLTITGLAYLCFASLLLFYELSMKNKETESVLFKNINSKHALVIGLAQAIALVPGVSRSGITLMVGLYLGIRKADAIYFSLLLGIPTIFGAWLLTFIETSYAFNPGIVIPVLVASISGFLAIKLLVSFTLNAKLKYFGFYCLLLSVICFIN
tara:strand:- start:84 stop:845 length:762 start_codon:yes stop_codon:yes gene_type:complete